MLIMWRGCSRASHTNCRKRGSRTHRAKQTCALRFLALSLQKFARFSWTFWSSHFPNLVVAGASGTAEGTKERTRMPRNKTQPQEWVPSTLLFKNTVIRFRMCSILSRRNRNSLAILINFSFSPSSSWVQQPELLHMMQAQRQGWGEDKLL